MNIFQAFQICKDIQHLRYQQETTKTYQKLHLCCSTTYTLDILDDNSNIKARRVYENLSAEDLIRIGILAFIRSFGGSDAKTRTLMFTVHINNKGMLPHAPTQPDYSCSGLAARIIYKKMRKECEFARKESNKQR